MKRHLNTILISSIFLAILFGLLLNIKQQKSIDRSKIPQRLEEDRTFQRWLTNLKNHNLDIGADDFRLKEENEIYNTTWMTVLSADDQKNKSLYNLTLSEHEDLDKVVFSPNRRIFVDFRQMSRDGVMANEVRLYGLKEDKIIDARVLDCSVKGNCYFDRAYFLDNDVFVISEISRDINKKDSSVPDCLKTEVCTYTIKIHIIDLIHNLRLVYASNPFDAVLSDLLKQLYD